MVEKVKQPETQETQQPTPTDETQTPTTRDYTVGQKFLQDLGDQYFGPNKTDATTGKVVEAKSEKEPEKHGGVARREEPSLLEFTNPFAAPQEQPHARAPHDREAPRSVIEDGERPQDRTPPAGPPLERPGERPFGKDGMIDVNAIEEKIKELQMLMALEAAKFIKKEGVEPKSAMIDSVKRNNVTFLGEFHTVGTDNPHRKMITEALKDMPKGSRLAIELPENLKPVFDKFNAGKPGSDLEIPDKLEGEYGKEALDLLKKVKEHSPDLIDMWKAARDNGIKVVPIDNTSVVMKDGDPRKNQEDAKRDQHMKDKLLEMVKEDPKSHVVAELGSLHAARATDDKPPRSAADMLFRDPEFKKMGGKIETFFGQIGQGPGITSPLWPATLEMEKPLSVKTKGADGKPNPVGALPIFSDPRTNRVFGYDLNAYDNVITYPMKPEELLKGLRGPAPIPGIDKPTDNDMGLIRDRVKTPEEIQQEDKEWERRRIPEIEERSKDIKGMKDLKLEPTGKVDIDPTPSKIEIDTMGVKPEEAAKVKAEVNKNGMTPEKALTEAMKSARVVGIDNPQIDWKQNLDFSMKAFKALKDGGATHAVFNVPTSMKPLLDEFNKTGVVDRTKLNINANTDYEATSMQAALYNGLKIVSGGTEAFIDNSKSDQRAKAIQDILDSDKNAKIVLVSSGEHLADGSDQHGHPSTVQRLRDAGVQVKTAKVTDSDSYDEKTAVLGRTLKAPVAIPIDKSPAIAALKGGFLGKQTMGNWDLNIIMPDVKKR
jgi:hypothetical protein